MSTKITTLDKTLKKELDVSILPATIIATTRTGFERPALLIFGQQGFREKVAADAEKVIFESFPQKVSGHETEMSGGSSSHRAISVWLRRFCEYSLPPPL